MTLKVLAVLSFVSAVVCGCGANTVETSNSHAVPIDPVEDIQPTGACTFDAGSFGPYPSMCECPQGYTYGGPKFGKCIRH